MLSSVFGPLISQSYCTFNFFHSLFCNIFSSFRTLGQNVFQMFLMLQVVFDLFANRTKMFDQKFGQVKLVLAGVQVRN